MTPRLTTQFWIDAYLLRLGQETIPVFITKKGDKTAGAILINLNLLDGTARLFHRSYDKDGARIWRVLQDGTEAEIKSAITRQIRTDPDVWVIEVESKTAQHLLDEIGLNEGKPAIT